MLNALTRMLVAAAMLFSLSVYAADQAAETGKSEPVPAKQEVTLSDQLANNPAQVVPSRIRADNMGYLFAEVQNPTQATLANVFVMVRHMDKNTGQPDLESRPLLVAKSLPPGQAARIKLEGLQVYKQAEFDLYHVTVIRAELAR